MEEHQGERLRKTGILIGMSSLPAKKRALKNYSITFASENEKLDQIQRFWLSEMEIFRSHSAWLHSYRSSGGAS